MWKRTTGLPHSRSHSRSQERKGSHRGLLGTPPASTHQAVPPPVHLHSVATLYVWRANVIWPQTCLTWTGVQLHLRVAAPSEPDALLRPLQLLLLRALKPGWPLSALQTADKSPGSFTGFVLFHPHHDLQGKRTFQGQGVGGSGVCECACHTIGP